MYCTNIAGLTGLDHWERLKRVNLYSQERRRERYMAIFLWKISEGKVRGYHVNFVEAGRRGRMAVVKPNVSSAPAAVQRAREGSLGVKGCRVFNTLPDYIRNMKGCTVDSFKFALDKFLATVPDQPTIPGFSGAAETNSLLHQVPMQAAQQ